MPHKPRPKGYAAFDNWLDKFSDADEALAQPSRALNQQWTGLQKQYIIDHYVEELPVPVRERKRKQKLSGKERRKLKKQRRKERELKEKRKRSKQ